MRLLRTLVVVANLVGSTAWVSAQDGDALKPFLKETSPVLVLDRVRVIDGTGASPRENQRIDIEAGKIIRVEDASLKDAYPSLEMSDKKGMAGLYGQAHAVKDKGNDVVELRRAGCGLLNVDTNQTFYRIAGGAANATYTASPSGNKYVCDDAGVVLVPCWLNADVNSLLGLGQGLTVNGIA